MNENNILSPSSDPMGSAIFDFHKNGKAKKLRVLSSMFDEDEIPVQHLFRTYQSMPLLEQTALKMAKGKILDIGAGAGCHSLYLQEKGFEVTSIDISPLSCEVMRERGLNDVRCINIFDERLIDQYDTILMLMNGIGIARTLQGLPSLLSRLSRLMSKDCQILIDSSDLRYIFEDEDGNLDYDIEEGYYGEVDYVMKYKNIKGEPFDWLYIDFNTLKTIAEGNGFGCQLVANGNHYDYLAKITK